MDNIVTEEDNPRGCMKSCWHYIQRIKLLVSSLAAVVLGIGLGLILKFYVPVSEYEQVCMSIPGGMLLRLLQVTSVPLVVTTLMTGVCSLTVETSRKVAVRAAAYVIATTLLSVATGLVLVLSIKPGGAHAASKEDAGGEAFSTIDALLDLVRNIVPTNLILASLLHQKTGRMEVEFEADEQPSSLETNATQVRLSGNFVQGTNILGLIVWSYVFGLVLNKMGEDGKVIVKFLTGLNDCLKYLVNLILGSLPVGVLFMMTSLVLEVPDWETVFKVGNFMAVVLLGLVIHGTCVLPLIYFLCTRRDPRVDIKVFLPALKAAFLNSSSSATLLLTLHCCEEINKGISRFMLPIGSNINGTALFEVVTAVFIAQFNHIHPEIGQLMTITVTSVLLSIGAAGIPSTGAMTTFFVLTAAGLPAKEASFLVVIEWLLDRCNTVINVMGDCIGVALVHQVLNDQEDTGARTGNGKTSDDHLVLCLARMHGRVAETRAPDDITVHVSPSAQDEDSDPEILCTAPEYPPDKDMYD